MREKDIVMTELYWTAGEQLMEMETVRREGLDLYFHTVETELTPVSDEFAPPTEGIAPILICRGDEVLAMVLPERVAAQALPGLPQLILREEGENDGLEGALRRVLKQPVQWRLEMEPAKEERLHALARVRLVQKWKGVWLPTLYGIDQRMASKCSRCGGRVVWQSCCSPDGWREIEKLLTWDPPGIYRPAEPIPFAQRRDRAAEGGFANGLYSARAVRRLARTPLEVYLAEFPESLAELKRWLPRSGEMATYMDAALLIDQLFLPREERPAALRNVPEDVPQTLLEHLARPLAGLYSAKRGA